MESPLPAAQNASPTSPQLSNRQKFITLILIFVFAFLPLLGCFGHFISLRTREFSLTSETINKPYHKDQKVTIKHIIAVGLPLCLIYAFAYIFTSQTKKRDAYLTFLAFIVGIGFTIPTTVTLKYSVGRLRPDFLARCKVDMEKAAQIDAQNIAEFGVVLAADYPCTGDSDTVEEGRQSFPSSHTSSSSCLATVCIALCIARTIDFLHRSDFHPFFRWRSGSCYNHPPATAMSPINSTEAQNTSVSSITAPEPTTSTVSSLPEVYTAILIRVIPLVLYLLPILLVLIVACNRVADNWHHPSDVCAGLIIGIIGGCMSFQVLLLPFPYYSHKEHSE